VEEPTPILLFSRTLGIGGCERDLTKIALGLDRGDYVAHVGCFYEGGCRAVELEAAGIPVTCFPVRSLTSLATLAQAARLMRYFHRYKIQLVHTFDAPTNIFVAPVARAARLGGVISSNLWYRDMLDRRALHLSRIMDHVVDRMVVNSVAVQNDLIEHERVSRGVTYLCYNGVDTGIFHSQDRSRLSIVERASVVIGTVCALRPEKRIDLLLDAYARIPSRGPDWRLLIVGSGPTLPSLRERARALGIEAETVFHPAQQDVAQVFRCIDIFVIPSSSESFPNALLEAMACGCCVIGSRVGGIPEAIIEGQNGLMFTPGSAEDLRHALSMAICNIPMRRRLSSNAARDARARFSMRTAMERIQELYDSLRCPEQ